MLLRLVGGSLFSITSKFAGESDSGAHDVVVGIRTRLQVNSVTRKPQMRGSVAVTHPGVPAICPDYFKLLLSYSYTSSSVSIY